MGEGDCDDDEDCDGALICGHNNCRNLESHWDNTADCCEGKSMQHIP